MTLSSLNPRDVAAIDLGRVLSRLEHKILSADTADPRLQHSSYERIKTSAVNFPFLSDSDVLDGDEKADGVRIRISNTPAPCSFASNIPPHPSNSPPKGLLPSPPSQRSAP